MKTIAANSKIRRLPDAVVRQIAAGEVIERPASVLKELIENSLDAGAAKIRIESLSAGKKLLRVTDNGAGMSPEDCRMAFERHTTSKISDIEDLDRLSTFGFRGEALFSVAAISRVTLTSCARPSAPIPVAKDRASGEQLDARPSPGGWSIQTEGGKILAERPAPPVPGTTIEVHDLFYNTPARAKFLKSDASEKSHLSRVIEEAALANPKVAFSFKSENRTSFHWAAVKEQIPKFHRSRILDVLGEDLGELLPVEESRGDLRLWAFLASANQLSPSRNFQFFFINRRPVTSRLLQQALYRAYEPFRSKDRHPVAVVYLEIPPDQFDVNVHPAKREVRFRLERNLFDFAAGAFSGALLRSKGIPSISGLRRGDEKDEPFGEVLSGKLTSGESCVRESRVPYLANTRKSSVADSNLRNEEAMLSLNFSSPLPSAGIASDRNAPRWYMPPFRYLGQIEQSYLVFDAAGGMLVIDQHAAQERILFERYRSEIESSKVRSQKLMLPLPVEMPASQIQRVLARDKELRQIGFEIKSFGKMAIHVTAAPTLFHKAADLRETIHRLLDSFQSGGTAAADALHHTVATIACKAAVKAHDRLSAPEALRLIEDLKKCQDGTCCPHGRPSMIALNRDELARRFKRPGAPPLA